MRGEFRRQRRAMACNERSERPRQKLTSAKNFPSRAEDGDQPSYDRMAGLTAALSGEDRGAQTERTQLPRESIFTNRPPRLFFHFAWKMLIILLIQSGQ
jgi:hypothetical protein